MSHVAARRLGSAVDRDARVLTAFLALLVARQRGGLLEVRARQAEGGMLQRFHRAARLREAADDLLELGARTDVYIGCAPRLRPAGDRSALGAVWALWVDCDGVPSVARLAAFAPAPAVVVRSGTGTNVHAYWPLVRPIAPDQATAANRQLADVLRADGRSADATRILRVPGYAQLQARPTACRHAGALEADPALHRRRAHRHVDRYRRRGPDDGAAGDADGRGPRSASVHSASRLRERPHKQHRRAQPEGQLPAA